MEELSPCGQAKLRFRWVSRLASPYISLSANLVREVCLYLCQVPQVLSVARNEVLWLNTDAKRWQRLCSLSAPICVSLGSASVLVSQQLLLVCGGYSVKAGVCEALNYVYRIDPSTGLTEQLESGLKTPRFAHGSIYHGSSLYVFGGLQEEWLLTACEEVTLQKAAPKLLPHLHTGKAWFNPCLHADIVYLCSNDTTQTYSPISNLMNSCPLLTIGHEAYAVAVVNQGQLVVFTSEFRYSWTIGSMGRFECKARTECSRLWSRCGPVITGDSLFLVSFDKEKTAIQLSLSTGAVLRHI